jgi:transposase-like protein
MSKRTGTGDAMLALPDRKWTRVDGERLVAAWQESGLSVREFARQHGIDAQRVQWWKRRIIGVAGETKLRKDQGARFVPVTARRSEGSQPAVIVRVGDAVIEVHEPSVVAPGWLAVLVSQYARKPA